MADTICQWNIERIPIIGYSRHLGENFLKVNLILKKGITTFGRAVDSTVNCGSVLCSRRHCSISLKNDGSLFITDHESLNGTFLHRDRIIPGREIALNSGDIIGLGVNPYVENLEHPLKDHFVFKITKLPKDELPSHDSNIEGPSCDDKKNPKVVEKPIELSSDEDDEAVQLIEENGQKNILANNELEISGSKLNLSVTTNNIITVDSDTEVSADIVNHDQDLAEKTAAKSSSVICEEYESPKEDRNVECDGVKNQKVEDEVKNKENDKETGLLKTEVEETELKTHSFTLDDDIILIDDENDVELPCSQLFDIKCEAEHVEEEPDLKQETNIDSEWPEINEIEDDSDTDSGEDDANQWFERLSQSHDPESDEEEEEEEIKDKENININKDVEVGSKNDCEDFSGKFIPDNQLLQQNSSEEECIMVIDDCESQYTEPLIRKLPSGSKRKLESSEEDSQDEHENNSRMEVDEVPERNTAKIRNVDEGSDSLNSNKSSNMLKNSSQDSKINEICTKFVSQRLSDQSDESSCSTKSKRLKKTNKLKEKSLKYRSTKVNLTTGSPESSDDSELEDWRIFPKETLSFIKMHSKKLHDTADKDQSVVSHTNLLNEKETEKYIFDDISDQIIPFKRKLSEDKEIPEKKECPDMQMEFASSIKKDDCVKSIVSIDKKVPDSESSKANCSDSKLVEIRKKINDSQNKKPLKVIEAKSLKTARKKGVPKIEQWLSSDKASHKSQHPSTDVKAERKQKLKDLAMKGAIENKQLEKPKSSTATSKTKSTKTSRNDIFLQDFISTQPDNNKVMEKDRKSEHKKVAASSLPNYKIPRRPSTAEVHVQTPLADSTISKDFEPSIESKPNKPPKRISNTQSVSKTLSNSINSKQKEPVSKSKTTNAPLVDQILKSTQGKSSYNSTTEKQYQIKTTDGGVENEEPYKVVYLNYEEYKQKFQENHDLPTKPKSIIKQHQTRGHNKKTTRFNFPDDDKGTIYICRSVFEVPENCKLKPVTKSAKHESPQAVKKPCWRKAGHPKSTLYFEETIYLICKWNTSWFEERHKLKDDPPVFSGQRYDLSSEFTDHSDYRRGMFPLLMYELWGTISRQFDLVDKHRNSRKNPLFNIEMRQIICKPVEVKFFSHEKSLVLGHMHCQVLLDKTQQDVWPHPGDIVLIYVSLEKTEINLNGKTKQLPEKNQILLGYIVHCPIAVGIDGYADVSPSLKLKSPNANMVMNGLNIYIRGDRTQPIDIKKKAMVKVLKNIKCDLRAFEALDRLPSSLLCKQIYQPKNNLVDLDSINIDQTSNQSTQLLDKSLNPSQKKAVMTIAKACLGNTNLIHLVHGPPGCGKTEVIINIILQMWYDCHGTYRNGNHWKQILLCAPSNSAIDDLVIKLLGRRESLINEGIPTFELIRVGVQQATHDSCSKVTLDHLTDMELKRLVEMKEDENLRRLEIECVKAKVEELNQKLDSLTSRSRSSTALQNMEGINKQIKDVEKKLAHTKSKLKFMESEKKPTERELRKLQWKETQMQLLRGAHIVATTLSSSYNGTMKDALHKGAISFDCCIVDEATQCIEPDTLIPLILGVKKLVLVGDPKQLPATIMSKTAKQHGLENSLFARHYGWWQKQQRMINIPENPCHFLDIQYRMHPEIAQWPSEHFYDKRLHSLETLGDRIPNCPLVPYVVLSHGHKQDAQEECNIEEGRLVASLLRAIVGHPLCQNFTIGIITPYNRQRNELKKRINLWDFPNVEIGTVDSYQGRERDVVIFSCVRTEGVGFMGGPERLNVALTRAKHSLIVVGNFMSLQSDSTWNSLLTNAKSRNLYKPVVNDHTVSSLVFK